MNSKYIKIKQKRKLKAKFFELFWVLHLVSKRVYKIKLSKKWKIYDVFHMSLLEQDTTMKKRVETVIKLDKSNSKKYKVKAICDNEVYAKKSNSDYHLSSLYYLVLWKSYSADKNTWSLALAIQHLWKLVTIFYYNYPNKPIATFLPIDSVLPMARPKVKPRTETVRKHSRLAKVNSTSKHAKKSWNANSLSRFWFRLNSRQKVLSVIWSFSLIFWFFPLLYLHPAFTVFLLRHQQESFFY